MKTAILSYGYKVTAEMREGLLEASSGELFEDDFLMTDYFDKNCDHILGVVIGTADTSYVRSLPTTSAEAIPLNQEQANTIERINRVIELYPNVASILLGTKYGFHLYMEVC